MEQHLLEEMYASLGISAQVRAFAAETEEQLKERFAAIDRTAEYNQLKVIRAMQENRVSDIHFAATTGYGYNDLDAMLVLKDILAHVWKNGKQ